MIEHVDLCLKDYPLNTQMLRLQKISSYILQEPKLAIFILIRAAEVS